MTAFRIRKTLDGTPLWLKRMAPSPTWAQPKAQARKFRAIGDARRAVALLSKEASAEIVQDQDEESRSGPQQKSVPGKPPG
jgi:uncharacterized damage-inducible protein DinB